MKKFFLLTLGWLCLAICACGIDEELLKRMRNAEDSAAWANAYAQEAYGRAAGLRQELAKAQEDLERLRREVEKQEEDLRDQKDEQRGQSNYANAEIFKLKNRVQEAMDWTSNNNFQILDLKDEVANLKAEVEKLRQQVECMKTVTHEIQPTDYMAKAGYHSVGFKNNPTVTVAQCLKHHMALKVTVRIYVHTNRTGRINVGLGDSKTVALVKTMPEKFMNGEFFQSVMSCAPQMFSGSKAEVSFTFSSAMLQAYCVSNASNSDCILMFLSAVQFDQDSCFTPYGQLEYSFGVDLQ